MTHQVLAISIFGQPCKYHLILATGDEYRACCRSEQRSNLCLQEYVNLICTVKLCGHICWHICRFHLSRVHHTMRNTLWLIAISRYIAVHPSSSEYHKVVFIQRKTMSRTVSIGGNFHSVDRDTISAIAWAGCGIYILAVCTSSTISIEALVRNDLLSVTCKRQSSFH